MITKVRARAHGRVNLIGEHTDYNGGWVLPTAIPQYTEVELQKIPGNMIKLLSEPDIAGLKRQATYTLGEEKSSHCWTDYLEGATKLVREVLQDNKVLTGLEARITSSIPEGSGLSSSAALEMSFLKALRELFHLCLSDLDLARIGQRIENEFVGARVGIMDQMATCLAKEGEALYLDTLTLSYERIKIPLDRMDLLVINSGISHRLSDSGGGYNQRREECEAICEGMGVKSLRDLSLSELEKSKLSALLKKRARHVISENARVKEAVKALKESDLLKLGELFVRSHQSMRDDFEVSLPEIDYLVDLCLKESDVFGARLTGGGFGGSIVAISKRGSKQEIAKKIISGYLSKTGRTASVLV